MGSDVLPVSTIVVLTEIVASLWVQEPTQPDDTEADKKFSDELPPPGWALSNGSGGDDGNGFSYIRVGELTVVWGRERPRPYKND